MSKMSDGSELPSDTWSIYPLFHFEAMWRSAPRSLDLDVRLIRADKACLTQMAEKDQGDAPFMGDWVYDPEVGAIRWVLALRVPSAAEHVPTTDTGVSFCEHVEEAIVTSFLTSLKILRSTPATCFCPISFFGNVRGHEVLEVLGHRPWNYDPTCTGDPPRCDWAEQFDDKDLALLPDVWSGMVKLRNLRDWMEVPFQEAFFQRISMTAKQQAEKNLRSRYSSLLLNDALTEDQKVRPKT